MRVTRSEHPERIDRFAHIDRAPRGRPSCGRECPGTGKVCTRERDHSGPHVSHGRLGRVHAAWDGPRAGPRATRSPVDRGYSGPHVPSRASPDESPLRRVVRGISDRFLSSVPETLMLVFFLAFVFFSIVWALQIL